jgi:GH25 family lysozyme M1 (1,4-beta-N-acetylmuramidase)
MGYIIDLSHYQEPGKINYDAMAKELDFAIIRTQYGSKTIDKHYKTHHKELQKRGIPTAAYAWVRGVSENDMRVEARDFYNRTKELEPTFWFLDVEEQSMGNMRAGVKAYVNELRKLGVNKIGAYIAHHLYEKFNLDLKDFDAVWIPRYGKNDGKPGQKPDYPCDLWQYTDKGKIAGYDGYVDLNQLTGTKSLDWFTGCKGIPATINGKTTKAVMYKGNSYLHNSVLSLLNTSGQNVPILKYNGEIYYQWNKIPGMKEANQRKDGGFDFIAVVQPKPEPKPQPGQDVKADYKGHKAEKEIEKVLTAGLMTVDDKGNFGPDTPMTRAEMAVVLARLMEKGTIK